MTPFELIAESGVPALLVGGQALHVHGYTRQTLDFDFMIAADDYARLQAFLEQRGFCEQGTMGQFGRFRPGPGEMPVIDLGKVDGATFQKLYAESLEHLWAGVPLRVPKLLHLIALKLHAARNPHRTDHDLGDIHALLRVNFGKWSEAELETACLRYGPAESFERLRRARPYES